MNGVQTHLREVWWLLLLRSIALLLFGLIAVLWPGLTLVALATVFAAYLIITGIVDIITGIRAEGRRTLWFLTMLLGLAEIGVAIFLLKTGLILATLIAIVGLSLIVIGIIEIVAAFESGEDSSRRLLLIISGGLGVIGGFIVLRYPVSSGLAFVWVLGVWGLLTGSLQIAMCLSLRSKYSDLVDKSEE